MDDDRTPNGDDAGKAGDDASSTQGGEQQGGTPATKTGEGAGSDGGSTGNDTPSGDGGDGEFDKDRALATIRKQRESEEAAIARAKAAEEELDKLKRERMTEAERAEADRKAEQEELARLRREAADRKVTDLFRDAAIEAGIPPKRLKAAQALAELELDDDGVVTNLEDAIGKLVEEHDYLVAGSGGGGGSAGGTRRKAPAEGGANAGKGSGSHDNGRPQATPEQIAMAERMGVSIETYLKHA